MKSKAKEKPMPAAAEAPAEEAYKADVLLVDDNPNNLVALEAALDPLGQRLWKARSGDEALRLMLDRDYAALLLDVRMPDLDGFETAAMIRERERSRHTPIIFLTAIDTEPVQMQRGYRLGAVDYIFKPVIAEVLRAKVSVFVQLHLQAERLRRQAVELARSNHELEQFAYIASHDLQEPLRKVTSFADLLGHKLEGKLDADTTVCMERIVDAVTRMQAMIDDLLDYSRAGREEATPRATDLNEVLSGALEDLASSIEESGSTVEADRLPTVRVNASAVAQLLRNLIGNAVKFRAADRAPRIRITARREGREWILSVADNGIGMSLEEGTKLFTIFSRLHGRGVYPGNGIGLAICKKIVERHGGRIWVESSEGKGSTFHFSLPEG